MEFVVYEGWRASNLYINANDWNELPKKNIMEMKKLKLVASCVNHVLCQFLLFCFLYTR